MGLEIEVGSHESVLQVAKKWSAYHKVPFTGFNASFLPLEEFQVKESLQLYCTTPSGLKSSLFVVQRQVALRRRAWGFERAVVPGTTFAPGLEDGQGIDITSSKGVLGSIKSFCQRVLGGSFAPGSVNVHIQRGWMTLPPEVSTLKEPLLVLLGKSLHPHALEDMPPPFAFGPHPFQAQGALSELPLLYSHSAQVKRRPVNTMAFLHGLMSKGAPVSLNTPKEEVVVMSPLGPLRVHRDGNNLEMATAPFYPTPENMAHVVALLQWLKKQGYWAQETDPLLQTGVHVNVEVLPHERRRRLGFLPPMLQEWLDNREGLFATF